MHNRILFLKSKPGRKCRGNRSPNTFIWRTGLLLACTLASLSTNNRIWAQPQKSTAAPIPTAKPHDPQGAKVCSDCHKRVTPSKVNCLLAKEDLCELCHIVPVEGGISRFVETSDPVCFKCHKKDQFKGSYAHGPFASGACVTCHDPHGGNVPGMLRITGQEMCLGCHEDMKVQFARGKFRHKPASTGCLDCHSPHASNQRQLLITAIPALCGQCHEKTVTSIAAAAVKHSPVTEDSACMNCHDPHTAQEGRLLLADEQDVCLKCHDKPVKSGNLEFSDMKQILASNPFPHGPLQNRNCTACHNPHGSQFSRLLTNQYPQDFYSPFFVTNYDLCFRCHNSKLATEEHTASATGFRDAERNLHFLHVNRTSHGRTCRSCHEVHASTTQEQVGATVPFGTWRLPVKFEKNENGGSCAPGCHAVQKYDRRPANK